MTDDDAIASVYVTAPSLDVARGLARSLLERRLVACANVVPATSLYWWDGRIEEESEVVVFLKTRRALVPAIESAVKDLHPYDVPCVVALDAVGGLPEYLAWIRAEATGAAPR